MKKLKGILLPIDIYNYDVNVIYGDTELMGEYLKIKYPKEYNEQDFKNIGAFCFIPNPNKKVLVEEIYIGKTKNNFKYISHESLHCALYLLNYCNVNIDPSDSSGHEALTYLVGYMTGYIQNAKKWYDYDFKNKKWNKK